MIESVSDQPENAPDPVERLARVTNDIAEITNRCGRKSDEITLVAVSKQQSIERVAALARAGQRDFGENYVDEALPKIAALADQDSAAGAPVWHYIGRIQSNKTRAIAEHFAWVHSIDRVKIAKRLSAQRPEGLPPIECCVEVNVSGEASKGGVAPAEIESLLAEIAALPRLSLRGLMALPAPESDPARQREAFDAVRRLKDALAPRFGLDVLSMGTTGDYPAAIAAGATHVRIGTALFGPRN